MYLSLGFHIRHVMRKIEIAVAVVTFGALLTRPGRDLAKGAGKAAKTGAQSLNRSWSERRRAKRELKAAAEQVQIISDLYNQSPEFRAAVDKACAPKTWWAKHF
jgi:hypothetical protein